MPITAITIKEIAITMGIMGSLFGVGVNYQATASTAKHADEAVKENKVDIKENQKINIQQTEKLAEVSTTLKYITKAVDKIVEKLDK